MGGRGSSGSRASGGSGLIGGKNNPEITDDIHDFYLPQSVRDKFPEIENIKSYDDLKEYLDKKGIKLSTDLDKLKNERSSDEIPAVAELGQKLAVGIETYEAVFGKDSMSALKAVNLYDATLDTKAAFHFNMVGENDPLAGTIRFRDWNADGHEVFHELAHAYQASRAGKGEDAVTWSNKIAKAKNLNLSSAYKGTTQGVEIAEMMAENISHGFTRNSSRGKEVIQKLRKKRK